ncbi:hypothetical protein OS493_002205 [Desmophyllum pertusum]|uniref:ZP domain-containing protein n=1 Tax=Desmophyllum pertusum TaxID=174260 RepID=A0A9W9Z559_9CNID|nr:hypothetical protein OS493_002205 [Desmophyllum pertusum]
MAVLFAIVFALVLNCGAQAEFGDLVTVECDLNQMRVHIAKTLIPDFRLKDVRLLDPNCQPMKSENSSHMIITAPLIGCGTTLEHTAESVIYMNMVKDGHATQAIISRVQALEIPFECAYPNHAAASLVQMNIKESGESIVLTPDDGSGIFDLDMSVYKNEDYDEMYTSFPLAVTLQQRLYFQISVDTPDTRLGIIADTCYATPINSLSKKTKYDIILDGCPTDETVRFHSGPSTAQRFSIEAFQFVNGQVEPYLYMHCEVELCNLTDAKPSCMKDCSEPRVDNRLKRAVNTDIYDLEKGPIIILRDSEDSFEDEPENEEEIGENQGLQSSSMTNWLFIVMGCICAICLAAVLHTIKEAKQAKQATNDH